MSNRLLCGCIKDLSGVKSYTCHYHHELEDELRRDSEHPSASCDTGDGQDDGSDSDASVDGDSEPYPESSPPYRFDWVPGDSAIFCGCPKCYSYGANSCCCACIDCVGLAFDARHWSSKFCDNITLDPVEKHLVVVFEYDDSDHDGDPSFSKSPYNPCVNGKFIVYGYNPMTKLECDKDFLESTNVHAEYCRLNGETKGETDVYITRKLREMLSQINGNNGSATNSDDVKGKGINIGDANPIWLTDSGSQDELAAKLDVFFGIHRNGNPAYNKYRDAIEKIEQGKKTSFVKAGPMSTPKILKTYKSMLFKSDDELRKLANVAKAEKKEMSFLVNPIKILSDFKKENNQDKNMIVAKPTKAGEPVKMTRTEKKVARQLRSHKMRDAELRTFPKTIQGAKNYPKGSNFNQDLDLTRKFELNDGEKAEIQAIKDSVIKPQINGNNGSATNLDDVKGKGAIKKAEKKIEKKLAKKTVKKQKKPKDKPKTGAVQTSLTATTFQETSTVQPYYKAGSTPNSKRTLFSLGVVNTSGSNAGSVFIDGGVNQSIAIDKNVFVGQSIGRDLDNYEMGRIKWAKYHFVPSIGSTTAGACWIFSDPDSLDVLPPNTVVQKSLLTSHAGSKKHTIWKDAFSGNCIFNKKWLYLDAALISNANTTADQSIDNVGDPRFTTFGVLSFINGENISTSTGALGEWFLEIEMDFKNPQFNDLSKFLYSSKAVAPSGGSLGNLANSVAIDPFRLANSFVTTGTPIQYEDVRNPRTVIPVGANSGAGSMQFRVTPGNYQFYVRISQSSGTSATISNVSFSYVLSNTIYSLTIDRIIIGSSLTSVVSPEFASNLNSGADALQNGALGLTIRLRVDSVSVGTFSVFTLQLTPTVSASFSIGAIHCDVLRMPDFSATPICMFHPQGVASGFVGLTNDVRITIWNGLRCDERGMRVSTMICPREFIPMVKESMMKKYVDYDEKYCFVRVDNQLGDNWPPLSGSFQHWRDYPQLYNNRQALEDSDKMRAEIEKLKNPLSSEEKTVLEGGHLHVNTVEEPESPEVVENPLTKSIHMNTNAVSALLSLVAAKRN